MNANTTASTSGPFLARIGWLGRLPRPTAPRGAVLGVVIALAVLGGCAREESLDPLAPAPGLAAGVVPADGPAPTTAVPPATTSPLTTTQWPLSKPPKLSTEPKRPTPDDPSGFLSLDIIRDVVDPRGASEDMVVLAWGDADGDGDNDAIVLTMWCGASCFHQLNLVLNDGGNPRLYSTSNDEFDPWFISSGVWQTFDVTANIEPSSQFLGSTITVTGRSLCGEVPISPAGVQPCDDDMLRTATYIYRDGVLSASSIEPQLGTGRTIEEVVDPYGQASSVEVLAWGDVDGDGDTDAVVRTGWCDASCGTHLDLVFATDAGAALYVSEPGGVTFSPYYNGFGEGQSFLSSVVIDDSPETVANYGGSLIELNGERLCNPDGQSTNYDCTGTQRVFIYENGLWAFEN